MNQKTPGWQYLEMDLPVRWAPNDPLERFVFDALCLDAKIPDIDTTHTHDTFVEKIDRNSLVKSNVTLSSIFALLVLAHYQTQPRDLRYLLDSIGLDIYLARCGDDIVGTAIVEREGNLDSATASAVYRNERRVHGHLLPQTIESFVGIKSASSAKYLRIVRIVVHPDFRRRGIGRKLLAAIEADARNNAIDVIGSNWNFGTTMIMCLYTSG